MPFKQNTSQMTCLLKEIKLLKWNVMQRSVFPLKSFLNEVPYKWTTFQMKWPSNEMPFKWNAFQMKCLSNEMPFKWNAFQMKCLSN